MGGLALVISSQFLGWRMPISAMLQRRSRHKLNESLLARTRAMCAHLVATLSRVSHSAISSFHAQPLPPPHQVLRTLLMWDIPLEMAKFRYEHAETAEEKQKALVELRGVLESRRSDDVTFPSML